MMALPFAVSESEYSVFVVLEDENLERLKEYDPAEVNIKKLVHPFQDRALRDVIIGYGTPEDVAQVVALAKEGKGVDGLRLLSRGFRFRPDRGDNDDPYVPVTKEAR